MSIANKKPFVKTLVESLTSTDLNALKTMLDGGGDQTILLRTTTQNVDQNDPRKKITVADKGVHRCSLEVNGGLYTWNGYLVYNNYYCVLIYYTNNYQRLGWLLFNVEAQTFSYINEELSVLELRNELVDFGQGGGYYNVEGFDGDISISEDDQHNKIIAASDIPSNPGTYILKDNGKYEGIFIYSIGEDLYRHKFQSLYRRFYKSGEVQDNESIIIGGSSDFVSHVNFHETATFSDGVSFIDTVSFDSSVTFRGNVNFSNANISGITKLYKHRIYFLGTIQDTDGDECEAGFTLIRTTNTSIVGTNYATNADNNLVSIFDFEDDYSGDHGVLVFFMNVSGAVKISFITNGGFKEYIISNIVDLTDTITEL